MHDAPVVFSTMAWHRAVYSPYCTTISYLCVVILGPQCLHLSRMKHLHEHWVCWVSTDVKNGEQTHPQVTLTVQNFITSHFYLQRPYFSLCCHPTIDMVNRTCGIHKNLLVYINPFLLTIFGSINYGPP